MTVTGNGAHGDAYRSPSCVLGEHACRAWKTCACACHKGRKLLNQIRRNIAGYPADPPF